MLAVKTRRASEYVPQVQPAPQIVALAGGDAAAMPTVESPARAMQAELAARLAAAPVVTDGASLRRRTAMVFGVAILCWLPILAAAVMLVA